MTLTITAPEATQLALATADIFTATVASLVKITLVNTDAASRTVNLYRKNSGGTATRILDKDYTLDAGREVTVGPVFVAAAGKIRGDASAATVVDVTLSVLTQA